MKKYEYLLTDWDGTIVKTLDVWLECLQEVLLTRGYRLSDNQVCANYSRFVEVAEGLGVSDAAGIVNEAWTLVPSKTAIVGLYDGAIELLEYLHSTNIKIALVTTSTKNQVCPILQKYDIGKYFDVLICGDDVNKQKPNRQPADMALKGLGATPAQSVMLGDSSTDLLMAQNTGLDSILFYPRSHEVFYDVRELKEQRPTYVVSSLNEVKTLI